MARQATSGLPTAVYLLADPLKPNYPRYVGTSVRPQAQYRLHCKHARDGKPGAKNDWIRKLQEAGREPELKVIEYFPKEEEALQLQQDLIRDYKAKGLRILNEATPSRGGVELDSGDDPMEGVVKPVGKNGAYIRVKRAWLGRKVRVIPLE